VSRALFSPWWPSKGSDRWLPLKRGREFCQMQMTKTSITSLYKSATVQTLLHFYVCSDNWILFHCWLHAQKFLMSTSTHLYADCPLQPAVVVLLCLFVTIDCLFALSREIVCLHVTIFFTLTHDLSLLKYHWKKMSHVIDNSYLLYHFNQFDRPLWLWHVGSVWQFDTSGWWLWQSPKFDRQCPNWYFVLCFRLN